MSTITFNHEGQSAHINITSIENLVTVLIQMGKDVMAWLVSVYESTRKKESTLYAA